MIVSCTQKEERFGFIYLSKNKIYLPGDAHKNVDSIQLDFYDTNIQNNFINRNYADCGLIDSPDLYVPFVITLDINEHPILASEVNLKNFYSQLPRCLGLSMNYMLVNVKLGEVDPFLDTSYRIISHGCRYNYEMVWPNYYYHIFKRNGDIKYNYVYFSNMMFPYDLMTIRKVNDVYIIEIYSKVSLAVTPRMRL